MEELVKLLVGKSLEDARNILIKKGLRHRVSEQDGEVMMLTQDLNPYRVNMVVVENFITQITFG
jgi:hypothetical protein